MTDPLSVWLKKLKQLLCRLYELWGGDCDDLGTNAHDWVVTVDGEYPPAPSTHDNDVLDDLEAHLAIDNDDDLSATDHQTLDTLIANIRSDWSVNP